MKRLAISLISKLPTAWSCRNETAYLAPKLYNLESYADSLYNVSIDSFRIAGGMIPIHQKGKTLLKKSFGYASLALAVTMPENVHFEIGSGAKQFIAAAILKLDGWLYYNQHQRWTH